ncbi:MAG: hypothetical protein JXX14_08900 [Deltaproteobacteria bacterium]|nr:hypothetical protein [Deltaproteobacteria bacterium]
MEPTAIVSKVRISKLKAEQFLHDNKVQFTQEIVKIMKGEYEPGTVLVLQYEEETESMIFVYWLELRNPESMMQMPGFEAFKQIATYKDIEASDLIVFSSSAPNFLTDPIWKAFQISVNEVTPVIPNNLSRKLISELDDILAKYIFETAKEKNDSIDSSGNPYCIFFNNKCVHSILVDEYNRSRG